MKQSLAIAYAMKRKKMKDGGSAESDESAMSQGLQSIRNALNKNQSPEEKARAQGEASASPDNYPGHAEGGQISESDADKFKKGMSGVFATGGEVSPYETDSADELLKEQVSPGFIPNKPQYHWIDGVKNTTNVAAKNEDNKDLNQKKVNMQASTSMSKQDLVDRIMEKENQEFDQLERLAMGGDVAGTLGKESYDNCEQDMTDRIMHKKANDESQLDRYSKGGQVANDVGTGQEADKLDNQYDDLVLRDDLESDYGDDDNSGDALGNKQEDEDRKDIISRILKSQAKKDRLPKVR